MDKCLGLQGKTQLRHFGKRSLTLLEVDKSYQILFFEWYYETLLATVDVYRGAVCPRCTINAKIVVARDWLAGLMSDRFESADEGFSEMGVLRVAY